MFLAYIRLFFRGSFVEITTAILLVYKILKMPLDVLRYNIVYNILILISDNNNQVHLMAF
jgi:hypothetical protein